MLRGLITNGQCPACEVCDFLKHVHANSEWGGGGGGVDKRYCLNKKADK